MSFSFVDSFIAGNKILLKSCSSRLSVFITIWKGEVITCTFDSLSNTVTDVFCVQPIDNDDLIELDRIINNFIYGEDSIY